MRERGGVGKNRRVLWIELAMETAGRCLDRLWRHALKGRKEYDEGGTIPWLMSGEVREGGD